MDSIKSRLVGDVDIGIFLSGLEPSMIASVAKLGKDIKSFTLGFEEEL